MSSGYSEAEAAAIALARDLVRGADPSTVKRLLAGDVVLAFAERNEVADLIDGLPIEAAYEALDRYSTTGAALKKYFGPPSAVSVKSAPVTSAKKAVIAAILQDKFGQTYTPPKPQKAAKPTTSKTQKPTAPHQVKQPFEAAAIATELQAATSESDARSLIEKIGSKPNHQAVARLLGVEYRAKDTIPMLEEAILRQVVTRRLEHDAYMRRAHPANIQS